MKWTGPGARIPTDLTARELTAAEAWLNRLLAPAFALLGRKDEARAHHRAMLDAYPQFVFDRTNQPLPFSEGFNDQMANGWEGIRIRSVE